MSDGARQLDPNIILQHIPEERRAEVWLSYVCEGDAHASRYFYDGNYPLVIDEHGVLRFKASEVVDAVWHHFRPHMNGFYADPAIPTRIKRDFCRMNGLSLSSFGDIDQFWTDEERADWDDE